MCRKFVKILVVSTVIGFFITGVMVTAAYAQETRNLSQDKLVLQAVAFGQSQLYLVTVSGRHRFDVEVAFTDIQRQQGLMNRPWMDKQAGMLFVFNDVQPVAMWMKNTLISLDMIFIAADGRIIRIAKNTKPHSLDVIRSGGKAKAVLEVVAGTAARLGLNPGDRVEHGIFNKSTRD